MPPNSQNAAISDWGKRLKDILKRLDNYSTLKLGWDSYDSPPPDAQSIERAKRLVIDLFNHGYTPTVVPDVNGGVGIEMNIADEFIWHVIENKP